FYPVAMKGEIGEAYVRHNLKIKDVDETGSLDPAGYCDKLVAKGRRRDNRVRIAVADEITCLSILKRMDGRGQLVFPPAPREPGRARPDPPSLPPWSRYQPHRPPRPRKDRSSPGLHRRGPHPAHHRQRPEHRLFVRCPAK